MDDVISLINHLINAKYSIDRIDSISNQLNISREQILRILRADRYKDYFQLLRNKNQGTEKIALTLDLFCCTHYAQQCKNQSCPFLHLCPYNIRPMHGKCTNKTCPYDHEVLKSTHNKKIINTRGLSFLSDNTLLELARVSADPNRSFWVCTDNGKKEGCAKKSQCEKLHYCYFSLINACTKPHCPHVINDACIAYFRHKELADQEQDDILEVFKKVLRQRKPDYIHTINLPPHPSWAVLATSNTNTFGANEKKKYSNCIGYRECSLSTSILFGHIPREPAIELQQQTSLTRSILSATAAEYNGKPLSKTDLSPPLPEDQRDILLFDSSDADEHAEAEHILTQEIGYSIKLLISKTIVSEYKNHQNRRSQIEPIHYYCPTENFNEIFQLLRSQNEVKQLMKPLIVYSNIRDAHEATELNLETNQFCLLRINLPQSDLSDETSLQLNDPSTIRFDRLWIYTYNGEEVL